LEIAEEMVKDGTVFSESAMTELKGMIALAQQCFEHSMEALHNNDKSLAATVKQEEAKTDDLQKELRHNHMMRLSNDECSPMAGVSFLDIITNLERVTDHAKNIAQMVERKKNNQ
jgi:phosphate:Na+ symporter